MPRPRIDAAGIGGSSPMGFKGSRVRIPPSRPLNPKNLARNRMPPKGGLNRLWYHRSATPGARRGVIAARGWVLASTPVYSSPTDLVDGFVPARARRR